MNRSNFVVVTDQHGVAVVELAILLDFGHVTVTPGFGYGLVTQAALANGSLVVGAFLVGVAVVRNAALVYFYAVVQAVLLSNGNVELTVLCDGSVVAFTRLANGRVVFPAVLVNVTGVAITALTDIRCPGCIDERWFRCRCRFDQHGKRCSYPPG